MLNLIDERYNDDDVLMQEIDAALFAMPLPSLPMNLSIRIAANVARYEMERELAEPEVGLTLWGWLDRFIAFITRPLVLATLAIVVVCWALFVANDPTWLAVTSRLSSMGDSIGSFLNSTLANFGQFLPALIVGMVLVAAVALTPRVRDLRQMLREQQVEAF